MVDQGKKLDFIFKSVMVTAALLVAVNFLVFFKFQPYINFSGSDSYDKTQAEYIEFINVTLGLVDKNTEFQTAISKLKSYETQENYNEIVTQYNALNKYIDTMPLLKNEPELKYKTQLTFNTIHPYLENSLKLINKNKNLNTVDVAFIKSSLDQLKQEISTLGFLNLNRPTLVFSSLVLLNVLLLLTSLGFGLWMLQHKSKLLEQKDSDLKTFMDMINNMSEGVIVTDRVGFFTYYNKAALDIIGPQIKDLHYQSSINLIGFHDIHGKPLEKIDLPIYKAIRNNIISDQEILVVNSSHPEGLFISVSNGVFINTRAEPYGAVMVMKNITHKKQLEDLWIKERNQAIQNSKNKSDFLATMSHEIRTPMNGIIGLTHLLKDSHLNEEQKDFVDTIQRSAFSLLNLINEILDHSKIEAGKIELIPAVFNLHDLLNDIRENFKFTCQEKNLDFNLTISKDIHPYLNADSQRLRQIFMNLVGNAVKFTTQGSISIEAQLTNKPAINLKNNSAIQWSDNLDKVQNDSHQTILFTIKDTGAGMEKSELDMLFQRYFQTKTGLQFGGTGLGLNISKQLIDLMKGSIGVSSEKGVGTTFWFELNLEKSDQEIANSNSQSTTLSSVQFNGHILVAEDNTINQKVIAQYLHRLGFTYDIAENGQAAFDLYSQSPEKYGLILMDCNMPVLNGYDASRKIINYQQKQQIASPASIVALTAEGPQIALDKCLDAGMTELINKPIIAENLIEVLKKYFICKENQVPIYSDSVSSTSSLSKIESEAKSKVSLKLKDGSSKSDPSLDDKVNFDESKFDVSFLTKLSEFDTGEDFLLDILLEDFKRTTPDMIQVLKVAHAEKDHQTVSDTAHTLKSTSAALGAIHFKSLLEAIEENPESLNEKALAEIQTEFECATDWIKQKIQIIKDNKRIAA